jgi:hypothetical protein
MGRTEVRPKDYERALVMDLTFFQLERNGALLRVRAVVCHNYA